MSDLVNKKRLSKIYKIISNQLLTIYLPTIKWENELLMPTSGPKSVKTSISGPKMLIFNKYNSKYSTEHITRAID